jgi:hypothetical protein
MAERHAMPHCGSDGGGVDVTPSAILSHAGNNAQSIASGSQTGVGREPGVVLFSALHVSFVLHRNIWTRQREFCYCVARRGTRREYPSDQRKDPWII